MLCGWLLTLALSMPAAWGHAALVSTSPAQGAVLQHAPTAIELNFSEPVGVTAMHLFGPDGQALHADPITADNNRIHIGLPKVSARGTYLLSWRIVSTDGHPVGGTLDFAIGAPSAGALAAAQSPSAPGLDTAIWLTRWLTYLSLFGVLGAALFRALASEQPHAWARRLVLPGLLILLADLALQGLDLVGASWTGVVQSGTWMAAVTSRYAWTLALAALALLSAHAALPARAPEARPAVPHWRCWIALSFVLLGAALAASGHASTAPPQWLARPLVFLHVILAVGWAGSLVPLVQAIGDAVDAPQRELRALQRFSARIVPVVILLILSGAGLAYLQLDRFSDLWRTAYGRVLLAKLCLVASMLCLAAANRWLYTNPALAGRPRARRHLRHAIQVETVIAVAVLGIVSLWRFTPPPRALDAAAQTTRTITLSNDTVHARITEGRPSWSVRLSTPEGQPFSAEQVTLILGNPAAGIEPLHRSLHHTAGSEWQASVPALPHSGEWRIRLKILIDDFDQTELESAPAPPGGGGG